MHTLSIQVSKAELEKLNYERFAYPHPMIQKRIAAVYLKAKFHYSNEMIGPIADLHYNVVAYWLSVYVEKGFKGLLSNHYGTNSSEMECHSGNILESFASHPPMSASEAAVRIEEMTGIKRSEQQVSVFMKKHGLKFIKCGHIPAKADTEQQKQWKVETLDPVIEAAKKGEVQYSIFFILHSLFLIPYSLFKNSLITTAWLCSSSFAE